MRFLKDHKKKHFKLKFKFQKVNEKKKVPVIMLNLIEDMDVTFLVDVFVEDLIKKVKDVEVVL